MFCKESTCIICSVAWSETKARVVCFDARGDLAWKCLKCSFLPEIHPNYNKKGGGNESD